MKIDKNDKIINLVEQVKHLETLIKKESLIENFYTKLDIQILKQEIKKLQGKKYEK